MLNTALVELRYPTGDGDGTEVEYAISAEKFHDAFAADVPLEESAVMAATQRPVSSLGFSERNGSPAWRTLPSWALVATGDKAAGADVVRAMAERAGAHIVEAAARTSSWSRSRRRWST